MTSVTSRIGGSHDTTRDRLLVAAENLVRELGPAGFTLREAARRADISHAAPGYLFGDLRGLRTEIALAGQRRFMAGMEAAERKLGDPLHRLIGIGTAYVEFARTDPQIFRLMVGNVYVDGTRAELVAQRLRSEGPLRRVMGELHGVTGETPEVLALVRLAWSTVHGLAHLVIDGPFAGSPAHERRIINDVLTALSPAVSTLKPDTAVRRRPRSKS
jgi:AcrR family transcriptional regulator